MAEVESSDGNGNSKTTGQHRQIIAETEEEHLPPHADSAHGGLSEDVETENQSLALPGTLTRNPDKAYKEAWQKFVKERKRRAKQFGMKSARAYEKKWTKENYKDDGLRDYVQRQKRKKESSVKKRRSMAEVESSDGNGNSKTTGQHRQIIAETEEEHLPPHADSAHGGLSEDVETENQSLALPGTLTRNPDKAYKEAWQKFVKERKRRAKQFGMKSARAYEKKWTKENYKDDGLRDYVQR